MSLLCTLLVSCVQYSTLYSKLGQIITAIYKHFPLNPPTPETFFSSNRHDFLKYCSRETPGTELREKYFFFSLEVYFIGVAKNVYLGVTGCVS